MTFVQVSNHGGRQIDSGPATIHILPEIVKAVSGKIPVFIDGGIRNGRDVFKVRASSTRHRNPAASRLSRWEPRESSSDAPHCGDWRSRLVRLPRSLVYLVWRTQGSEGVSHVINILRQELEYTMQLAGDEWSNET